MDRVRCSRGESRTNGVARVRSRAFILCDDVAYRIFLGLVGAVLSKSLSLLPTLSSRAKRHGKHRPSRLYRVRASTELLVHDKLLGSLFAYVQEEVLFLRSTFGNTYVSLNTAVAS